MRSGKGFLQLGEVVYRWSVHHRKAFDRGYERGARDLGTLVETDYQNGRGSAMRYGSRIGRDMGRFGIFRLRSLSLFIRYGETAVLDRIRSWSL